MSCNINDCDRPVCARGICNTHYAYIKRTGGDLPDTLPTRPKVCVIEGCINKHKSYGLCATHQYRKKRGMPDWDTRPIAKRINHGKVTGYTPDEYQRYKLYKMRKGEYEVLLEKQGGGCAICGKQCSTGRRLSVDHDHNTGQIRGLLCMHCNQGLGKFNDNPALLDRAANYLRKG